jgi:hypothetical protein
MKRLGDYPGKQGYSVWENTNKELVAKIKAIKQKLSIKVGDTVNHWRSKECKVVSFINDKEALVYSEKHKWHEVHQLENEQEQLGDSHLQIINDTFKVEDYFAENFGIIANNREIVLGIENVMPPNPHRKESYDRVWVAGLKTSRIDTSTYQGFKFNYADCYGTVSCFFDENGNYVNRDHNLDLQNYKVVDPKEHKQKQVDEFLQTLSDSLAKELYHIKGTNTWFSKDFAYELSTESRNHQRLQGFVLELDARPKNGSGNAYYHRGLSSNSLKLSKACEKSVVTKESLLKLLRGEIEDALGLK